MLLLYLGIKWALIPEVSVTVSMLENKPPLSFAKYRTAAESKG